MNNAASENYIYRKLAQLFPDVEHNRLMCLKNRDVEIDVYIDSLHLAIEYDGPHHQNRVKKDESKNYRLKQAGIQVFRIREMGLPPLRSFGALTLTYDPQQPGALDDCLHQILEEIVNRFPLSDKTLEQIQAWGTHPISAGTPE